MYIRKSNEYTDQRAAIVFIDASTTFLGHSDLSRSTRYRIILLHKRSICAGEMYSKSVEWADDNFGLVSM